MTSPFESSVRDGLRLVADGPTGPALADRALADARRMRLRRRSLVALAAIAVVGAGAAVPFVVTSRGDLAPAEVTPTAQPTVDCREATNEPAPPAGVIPETWPSFVGIVMAHLPTRDDYHLASGYGMCQHGARMVMEIGEQGAHGQFVVELMPDFYGALPAGNEPVNLSCPSLAATAQEVYFCSDATATEPLVWGGVDERGATYVFALHADGRWIIFENNGADVAPETMRDIVTDPALAALLG
jgi:hypothetical protein